MLVENFLQKLGKKGSKLLPALTLFLAVSLNTACDGVDKMLGEPTEAEISAQKSEEELGLVAKNYSKNVDVSVVGMQNAKEAYKQIDSSIRRAERTLKELEERNFEDPRDKEVWKKQILQSIAALAQLKRQVERNGGFANVNLKGQAKVLKNNMTLIEDLGNILGWRNLDGSYTVK